jgi:hypothetical protein
VWGSSRISVSLMRSVKSKTQSNPFTTEGTETDSWVQTTSTTIPYIPFSKTQSIPFTTGTTETTGTTSWI